MPSRGPALVLLLLATAVAAAGCVRTRATTNADPAPAATAAEGRSSPVLAMREWWQAFTVADTAYVREWSSPELGVSLSSGRAFDLAGTIAEAASHVKGARLTMTFADETARFPAPGVAVVTSVLTEDDGPLVHARYRYVTVLERAGLGWRVLSAHSTRIAERTPRAPLAVAGALADYAGAYLTPRGLQLRVVARDSMLALVEPGGSAELPMAPIGPGLFEFVETSPSNGVVRFAFTRDATGRVTGMSRLVNAMVTTFPRAQ